MTKLCYLTYFDRHRMELRKSSILKITAMNLISWRHELFYLKLKSPRDITQKVRNLLIPLFLETPCTYLDPSANPH